jgi:diguanylate cyclase (GGDEF)-like protein/PAS domain S-box-containing protein
MGAMEQGSVTNLEHRRALDALDRCERLLEVALTAGPQLAAADSADAALSAVLRQLCAAVSWDAARYFVLDEGGDGLRQLALSGLQERGVLAAGAVVPEWLGEGPVWITDLGTDERTLKSAPVSGSALLVPIFAARRFAGVLEFHSTRIVSPDAAFVRVVEGIAAQLGHLEVRAATLERLRDSEERLASTLQLAAIGISHVGDQGRFLYVNPQLSAMLGYTEHELLACTVKDISHPDDVGATDDLVARLRNGEISSFKREKRYLRKDGSVVWVALTAAVKRDRAGNRLYDVTIVEDVSARKQAEQRVQYLASHDSLTDLPNRATFAETLKVASHSARRHGRSLAVLFIDLDRFKWVNDTLGHDAGDTLLREVAGRLRSAVRQSDVVARLGGDEFVVLLNDVAAPSDATRVAHAVLESLRVPVAIDGRQCAVSASIGICLHPDGDQDDQAVLKNADMAMYLAKQSGKNGYRLYVNEIREQAAERAVLEAHLQRAIEASELSLRYAPRVLAGQTALGAVRVEMHWHAEELRNVEPDTLRSVAAEVGLARRINDWVRRQALADSRARRRAGARAITIALDVGFAELMDGDFYDGLRDQLRESGLAPELCELTVSEDVLLRNPERAAHAVRALKSLGTPVALEGFGEGRLSFADVKRFGIDRLRLAASRTDGIAQSADKQEFWQGARMLGQALGVTLIATGVSTAADVAFLAAHGGTWLEGPAAGKRLSADECESAALAHPPSP